MSVACACTASGILHATDSAAMARVTFSTRNWCTDGASWYDGTEPGASAFATAHSTEPSRMNCWKSVSDAVPAFSVLFGVVQGGVR